MKTRQTVEESLNALEGFKAFFSGHFGGMKAKKSFAIYSSASEHGVFDLVALRRDRHDSSNYAVFAFSKKGTIEPSARKTLEERAKEIPLGTIRYESLSYGKLELWRGPEGSFARENNTIATLSEEWSDIFVFPVATENGPEALNCPYIIYAHKDGEDYIYPVPARKLN
jgi:hypothetical protein